MSAAMFSRRKEFQWTVLLLLLFGFGGFELGFEEFEK